MLFVIAVEIVSDGGLVVGAAKPLVHMFFVRVEKIQRRAQFGFGRSRGMKAISSSFALRVKFETGNHFRSTVRM